MPLFSTAAAATLTQVPPSHLVFASIPRCQFPRGSFEESESAARGAEIVSYVDFYRQGYWIIKNVVTVIFDSIYREIVSST